MDPIENRLFDLLETFSFEALTEEDKLFVLSNMTEQEFRTQQKVLVATDALVYPSAAPLPLVIPTKKAGFWLSPIPLYQILAAAAAAIIAIVLLWPKNQGDIKDLYALETPTRDTIYHTKLVHDTVYKTEIEKIYLKKSAEPKTVYVDCDLSNTNGPKRMLEVNSSSSIPPISPNVLTSNTKSLKNDETTTLLPDVQEFGL